MPSWTMPTQETPHILKQSKNGVTGGVAAMTVADEAQGTSVLTDWEGTVDAAIRIHEGIYRRLQGLQGTGAGLGTDRVSAERATRGTARDATQLVVRII